MLFPRRLGGVLEVINHEVLAPRLLALLLRAPGVHDISRKLLHVLRPRLRDAPPFGHGLPLRVGGELRPREVTECAGDGGRHARVGEVLRVSRLGFPAQHLPVAKALIRRDGTLVHIEGGPRRECSFPQGGRQTQRTRRGQACTRNPSAVRCVEAGGTQGWTVT